MEKFIDLLHRYFGLLQNETQADHAGAVSLPVLIQELHPSVLVVLDSRNTFSVYFDSQDFQVRNNLDQKCWKVVTDRQLSDMSMGKIICLCGTFNFCTSMKIRDCFDHVGDLEMTRKGWEMRTPKKFGG